MKNKGVKVLAFVCTAIMLFSSFSTALAIQTTANINEDQYIYVEGQPIVCLNEQGKRVPILSYNNSTYIPVRTAGEWMGKTVSWDPDTSTITLSGSGEEIYYNGYDEIDTPSANTNTSDTVSITTHPDIKIIVDGATKSFINQQGKAVYPIVYGGVTYLPLRNMGELIGKEVTWISPISGISIIYMRTPVTEEQCTEVNSYIQQQITMMNQAGVPLMGLLNPQQVTSDQVNTWITTAKAQLTEMKNVSQPNAKVSQFAYKRYQKDLTDALNTVSKIDGSSDSKQISELATEALETCSSSYYWLTLMADTLEQTGTTDLPHFNLSY